MCQFLKVYVIKQDSKHDGQLDKRARQFWKAYENIGPVWKDRKIKKINKNVPFMIRIGASWKLDVF